MMVVLMRPGWDTVATPTSLSNLRQAVSSGTISILLSMVALEELIADPEDYQPRRQHWRLNYRIGAGRLRQPSLFLLKRFSPMRQVGRPAAPIFTGRQQWELVKGLSSTILGTTPEDIAARKELNETACKQIDTFHEARREDRTPLCSC